MVSYFVSIADIIGLTILNSGVSDGFGLPLLQFYLNEPAPLNICGQYCDAPYTMYRVDANGGKFFSSEV